MISDGTEMHLVASGSESRAVAAWPSQNPERGAGGLGGQASQSTWSPVGVDGGRDWSEFHALPMHQVRPGEWTTYGDLTHAVGIAPDRRRSTHRRMRRMRKRLARALGSDGRPRPSFQWADPERQKPVRDVLSAEDVRFLNSGSNRSIAESHRGRSRVRWFRRSEPASDDAVALLWRQRCERLLRRVEALPATPGRDDIIVEDGVLARDGPISVYYVPVDHTPLAPRARDRRRDARTGRSMQLAFQVARERLRAGDC